MSRKVEACAECSHRCIQLHGKTQNSSSVTSFFKVMFGDLFSKVVHLPPMFAATVPRLVNKKVVLEDSLGQQWEVTVFNHEGTLAFGEGWSVFSSEHSLKKGDFVIFNQIMDLHFIVRIYSRSGCEKVEFSKKSNLGKRSRSPRTSVAFETIDKGITSPQGSGSDIPVFQDKRDVVGSQNMIVVEDKKPKPRSNGEWHRPLIKKERFDDSHRFMYPTKEDGLEENRSHLLDLFSMEIPKCKSSFNKNEINNVSGDELCPNLTAITMSTAIDTVQIDKAHAVRGENMELLPSNISGNETIKKIHPYEDVDIKTNVVDKDSYHNKTKKVSPVKSVVYYKKKDRKHFHEMPSKLEKECRNDLTKCNTPSRMGRHDKVEAVSHESLSLSFPTNIPSAKQKDTSNFQSVQKRLSGKVPKIIKKEALELTTEMDKHKDFNNEIWESKVIKEEFIEKLNKTSEGDNDDHQVSNTDNADADGTSSPKTSYISCLVAKDTQSFLELPMCLPSSYSRGRRAIAAEKRKVVYLRDREKRMWPILYHEMPEIQVLTSGWGAFSSANQIQPGDECLFKVEDEFERIYEVSIRKFKN